MMKRRYFVWPLVMGLVVTLSGAEPTSPTKKASTSKSQRRTPLKRIQDAPKDLERTLRNTSPNPQVQKPSVSAMPPQAPVMPAGPSADTHTGQSGADWFFNTVSKVMTKSWKGNIFVWLPAISTDPNTGPTFGLMPVLVLSDPISHHIRHLLAPSYTYNDLFGQTGTFRYYFYPTDESQMYAVASYSQRTNREFKLRYETPGLKNGLFYLRAETYYKINGAERFYGLGPNTRKSDESSYASRDVTFRGSFGVNFFEHWRATIGQRVRRYETRNNIVEDVDDTVLRYAGTPGVGTQSIVTNEFRLLWDTRDTPITPSQGRSGEFFFEKTSQAMGSDADYIRYGMEGKRFMVWTPKQITVVRGFYDWAHGSNIPFYESPSLGGRNSLRGFGERRFVDQGSTVFNIEHRYRISSLALMGVQTNFEIAPFFDIGTVFPAVQKMRADNFRPVYGTAFRAAVKPNVVGDVEVGYGKEGVAVFVDINYPF